MKKINIRTVFKGCLRISNGYPIYSFYARSPRRLKNNDFSKMAVVLYLFLGIFGVLFAGQEASTNRKANVREEYIAARRILNAKRLVSEADRQKARANDLRSYLVAIGFNKEYVKNTYGASVSCSNVAKTTARLEVEFNRCFPNVQLDAASALLKQYDFTVNRDNCRNLNVVREIRDVLENARKDGFLNDAVFKRLNNCLKKFYSSDEKEKVQKELITLLEDRGL